MYEMAVTAAAAIRGRRFLSDNKKLRVNTVNRSHVCVMQRLSAMPGEREKTPANISLAIARWIAFTVSGAVALYTIYVCV